MSKVSLTKEVSAPIQDFYAIVADYESYPKFISEIKKARVVCEKPKRVEFTLELMKTFQYILEFKEKSPSEVSWKLVESNLFQKNSGGWKLKEKKGVLEATYTLDVEFGFFVPSLITNPLVKRDLPKMIERFEARALAKVV
ncbi:MAG: SRPBCC family protein [Deltaproteobacteria bacterium]|nr:SRPBCC family protein [Deltaproteobacteria bacterium]